MKGPAHPDSINPEQTQLEDWSDVPDARCWIVEWHRDLPNRDQGLGFISGIVLT